MSEQTDTERLDWLDSQRWERNRDRPPYKAFCQVVLTHYGSVVSIREAIDLAIAAEKQPASKSMSEITESPTALAVIEAARCIRHWHDSGNDGMVVSKSHAFALWDALRAYDEAQKQPAPQGAHNEMMGRLTPKRKPVTEGIV